MIEGVIKHDRTITMKHNPIAGSIGDGGMQTFLCLHQQSIEIHGRALTEHGKKEVWRPIRKWNGTESTDVWVYGHKAQPTWGGEDERG